MKIRPSMEVVLSGLLLFQSSNLATGTDFAIVLHRDGGHLELTWPASVQGTQASLSPEYTVEQSFDLRTWAPIGGKVRALAGRSASWLNVALEALPGPVFYRVKADLDSTNPQETASDGAEVLGFTGELAQELQRLGFLTVEDFQNAYPVPAYLPRITFDPTTAKYWTNFNANPAEWNANLPTNSPDLRLYDFRLNPAELECFMTNGFVVSERLGTYSFGDAYYRIYTDDLPVFITTDSILQAWHRSYVNMLREIEELQLATLLEGLLTNMNGAVPGAWSEYGQGDLRQALLDADYFLTVARSLWFGQQLPGTIPGAGQEAKVAATLQAISNLGREFIQLFGGTNSLREVDFSQFKVRGYYDSTERLRRYFKTMMWCSRIDLRLGVELSSASELDPSDLGVALVLNDLLLRSGQYQTWSQIEQVTTVFVGPTDSLTFAGLGGLLRDSGIPSLRGVTWTTLTNLQTRLLSGELGVQNIIGDIFYSPLSADQLKLPRSFTLLGQKFVVDSWALSQVVFDRILWPVAAGSTNVDKVIRRKPSGVDVAFTVLANDHAAPILADRITATNGVVFRDGQPYQHNLAAVRNVLDRALPAWATNNIYGTWLNALRALSQPVTNSGAPQAMRTRAWAMKGLNTELGSWTELRHDTVLYAKQSYTPPYACDYPAGFVEPVPEFWKRMGKLADISALAISNLNLSGWFYLPPRSPQDPLPILVDLSSVKLAQLRFCTNFAGVMKKLQAMSEKELASVAFDTNEVNFIKSVVENVYTYIGARQFNGWYPGLFYAPMSSGYTFQQDDGCDKWDVLVTDVHTDVPDPIVGDPGAIIHEGMRNVNLLFIAVDNGPDRMVYAGPVFSYYEFEMPFGTRLTDAEWQTTTPPPAPDWTRAYLVPRN